MGGSAENAAALSRAAATAEQARALQARIAMAGRKFEQGLQLLAALPATLPAELAEDVRAWAVQCALGLASTGQSAKAQPAMEKLRREHAAYAGPAYALARLRGEQGAHEEALKLFEQAALLKGADLYPLPYRIGIAQQELGRPDAAKVSLQRYVALGRGQKASLEDARKRLVQLGS
jgi:tetratricopeptide (TPR) repeat protein